MSDSQGILDPAKLRRMRIEAGLNQADLADLAKVDPSHVSLLEKGKRGTTARTLGRFAAALGCKTTDLMPDQVAA